MAISVEQFARTSRVIKDRLLSPLKPEVVTPYDRFERLVQADIRAANFNAYELMYAYAGDELVTAHTDNNGNEARLLEHEAYGILKKYGRQANSFVWDPIPTLSWNGRQEKSAIHPSAIYGHIVFHETYTLEEDGSIVKKSLGIRARNERDNMLFSEFGTNPQEPDNYGSFLTAFSQSRDPSFLR